MLTIREKLLFLWNGLSAKLSFDKTHGNQNTEIITVTRLRTFKILTVKCEFQWFEIGKRYTTDDVKQM